MANQYTHAVPQGAMQLLQNQRKLPNGSPKMAPQSSKTIKTNITKTANGTRTGDAVSDDSEDGDGEGDSSSSEDEDDDIDEPDGFALSGAPRIGNGVLSRLAGLSPADADMLDAGQAVGGAEQLDEEDYGAVDDVSDGDESVVDVNEKNVLRSAERDLIAEFERTEKPRNTKAVSNEIGHLSLSDDAAEARQSALETEDSQQYNDLGVFNLDFNEDPFMGLPAHDTLYQEMIGDAEGLLNSDLGLWRMNDQSRESSAPSSVTQKRVRFDEPTSSRTSSMSSSEEDHRDSYPDLFDGNDDPLLRHQMLMSSADAIQDNESVYDFEDEYERAAFEIDEEESDSNSDDSDDSCIDSLFLST